METGKYYVTQRVHIPDLSLSEPPGELVKMQVLIRQVWVGPKIRGDANIASLKCTLRRTGLYLDQGFPASALVAFGAG